MLETPVALVIFPYWRVLGLKDAPENIPVARLVNFVEKILATEQCNQEMIFVCRSGESSFQIVNALRKLGFLNVWSLNGGLVLLENALRKTLDKSLKEQCETV